MTALPRPEPVTRAGALAGLVSAVLMALGLTARAFGWIADDVDLVAVATRASDVVLGAAALWATVAPIALAVRARARVTPLADPRDDAGRALAVMDTLAVVDQVGPAVAHVRRYLDELLLDQAAQLADRPGEHAAPETPAPVPAHAPAHVPAPMATVTDTAPAFPGTYPPAP